MTVYPPFVVWVRSRIVKAVVMHRVGLTMFFLFVIHVSIHA
jgi:hypothetical protein